VFSQSLRVHHFIRYNDSVDALSAHAAASFAATATSITKGSAAGGCQLRLQRLRQPWDHAPILTHGVVLIPQCNVTPRAWRSYIEVANENIQSLKKHILKTASTY